MVVDCWLSVVCRLLVVPCCLSCVVRFVRFVIVCFRLFVDACCRLLFVCRDCLFFVSRCAWFDGCSRALPVVVCWSLLVVS